MFAFLFILVTTVKCGCFESISSVQLLQRMHHRNTHFAEEGMEQRIEMELRQRISANQDNQSDLLWTMYTQRMSRNRIWGSALDIQLTICENVRMRMQREIDEKCSSSYCILTKESSEMTNNSLKALAYFGKEIVVPSHVTYLALSNFHITSLWLRFEQDSRIEALSLPNSDFDELDGETFGQYIHEDVKKQLKTLSIAGSQSITKIDFDELVLPNLQVMNVNKCTALSDIKNIPSTMERIFFKETSIRHKEQLTFEEQIGNALVQVHCDEGLDEEFKSLLTVVHQEEESDDPNEPQHHTDLQVTSQAGHQLQDGGSAPEAGCQCVIS